MRIAVQIPRALVKANIVAGIYDASALTARGEAEAGEYTHNYYTYLLGGTSTP